MNDVLSGARIWLSGSIPEPEHCGEEQREAILTFVRTFARRVFTGGGYIVHGSHPSFTPVLLEQAEGVHKAGGRKDLLTLAVSQYFANEPGRAKKSEWEHHALVHEIPGVTGDRAASLDRLRKWMAARCDAIVVVGGKMWRLAAGMAGTHRELDLALERGLPCFLLAGLGGATEEYVSANPAVLSRLRNGFDEVTNRGLLREQEVSTLAAKICDQLERLPLVRGKGSDGSSFRILALDGGGLKGTFTAAALAQWERQTGRRVSEHFELIAGTSTGGILAIGLGLGLTAEKVLGFYRDRGPVIFPVTRIRGRIRHLFRHVLCPKYSQEILLRELKAVLGTKTLSDSHCRLVIPAYAAVAGRSYVFRTPHHPDRTADAATLAAHAALATAAAPTFFSAAKIKGLVSESAYLDGGVWANSPALTAIIEAVCVLGVPLERIDVLSVGTTNEPFSVTQQSRAGVLGWLWKKKILDLLMNVQQESSLSLASLLAGEPRFLRVDAVTEPGRYQLDSSAAIKELEDLGANKASDPNVFSKVRSRFLNEVAIVPWK